MTRFIMFFLCSVEQTWLFIIERPSSVGEWGLGAWGGGVHVRMQNGRLRPRALEL